MLLAGGAGQSRAELPSLNKAPWFGFFAGHNGTRGQFAIAADGSMYYNHSEERSISGGHFHRIHPSVLETMPNGEVVRQRLIPDTLESSDTPTDKPDKITYRAKVRGGTTIEVVVEFSRRDVSVGGRIVEPGPGDNPRQFVLYTQAPPHYLMYGERKTMQEGTAAEKAKLEQQVARQRVTAAKEALVLRGVDGRRVSLPILDPVDLSDPELNGAGFSTLDVDLNWLKGRKINITATEGSRMTLSNEENRPIFKNNYYLTWMEDPASRDPGKGRLVFTTR